MKKQILILATAFLGIYNGTSQESEKVEKKEKNTSLVIMPIHNSVAGFSNVFLGTSEINKKTNFTFYSIFWTNPNFGTPAAGSDLWLETGVGLGFKLNKWYINPGLGLAHGKFLSGGKETLIGEGVIPKVLALYSNDVFEFETYVAYYKAARKGSSDAITKDYLLNWIAPGVKFNKRVSMGAFYEQFVRTRTTDNLNEQSVYQWLGGYVKIALNNHIWFRVAAGPNLFTDSGTSKEFYKVQAFIPIN